MFIAKNNNETAIIKRNSQTIQNLKDDIKEFFFFGVLCVVKRD